MTRTTSRAARAALILFVAGSAAAQQGQQGQVWDLGTQQSGKSFPTEITAFNESCRGSRDFTLAIEGEIARFLSITGPTELRGLRRGERRSTPARLDLVGAPAGSVEGQVVSRCTNCPASCHLDHRTITVLLTVTMPPGTAPPSTVAAAPGDAPAVGGSADPDGNCSFLPRVETSWESSPAGAPAIVESEGTFVVFLAPESPFWTVDRSTGRTADTTWEPAPPAGPATTRAAGTTWDLASQTRDLCLEHLEPCADLLAKARAAEEAYRAAQARADAATARESYDRAEAAALDEETARDRAYAATLRRQAAEWRKLAADARADAARNRDRARRQRDYAESWKREAARDETRAAERDARAKRLEDEAARIEARIRDKTGRADATRGRAEAARQEATAAKQALDLARAEYEACLERQRLECERQRREAVLAAQRAQAAAAASRSTTSGSGGSTTTGPSAPPPTRGRYSNYESLPVQVAPFCRWVRYNVPYGETADRVRVVALSSRDTTSALEVREMESGTSSTGKGFEYHCKSTTGSAVILFTQVSGEVKQYKLRVGCVAE